MSNESNFHKRRLTFAVLDNEVKYTIGDKRSHFDWLNQDFNVTEQQFGNIIRGYVYKEKIYFYRGFQFVAVDDAEITNEILLDIIQKANVFNTWEIKEYKVISGVIPGKIGEPWKPVKDIGTVEVVHKKSWK